METYTITRTGDRPLTFGGEIVAEASSYEHGGGPLELRWHEITVYRTHLGGFVAAVEFRSKWQAEHDHHAAAEVKDADELTAFLKGYDPHHHYHGYPSNPQFDEKNRRLRQTIDGGYRRAVSAVLADFPVEPTLGAK